MTTEARLADALRAEHAAIYGYGVLGARLDGAALTLANQAEAAHRQRRDALVVRLGNGGAVPPGAEPAYALPAPVNDQPSALRLAATIEDRTAALWRAVLPETTVLPESDGADRAMALDALIDCAVRATRARNAAGIEPATVAFPGKP